MNETSAFKVVLLITIPDVREYSLYIHMAHVLAIFNTLTHASIVSLVSPTALQHASNPGCQSRSLMVKSANALNNTNVIMYACDPSSTTMDASVNLNVCIRSIRSSSSLSLNPICARIIENLSIQGIYQHLVIQHSFIRLTFQVSFH